MAIVEFRKREELKILFGIRLPSVVTAFYKEMKNKKTSYEIIKDEFNISKERLVNIVDVVDVKGETASILVIYDNFVSERGKFRLNLEIEVFDFNIFELDYNNKTDIEDIIKRIKN